MKKIVNLLILLNLGFSSINSQLPNTLLISGNTVDIKKDNINVLSENEKDTLHAVSYEYNVKIFNIQFDSIYNNIIAFLKFKNNEGYKDICSYNLDRDSILWHYKSFAQRCNFVKNHIGLIYSDQTSNQIKVFLLDRKNGTPIQVKNNIVLYPIPEMNIYIALPLYGFKKEMEILDIQSCSILGSYRIPIEYSVSAYSRHDSILYLNIDGIYAFDKNFNMIWDYNLSTMVPDASIALLSMIFGVTIGIFTGYMPIYNISNHATMLNSNFLFSGNKIFCSDRNNILCLDKNNGNELWKNILPYKTGCSLINKINEHKGLLINTGLCIKNGQINKFCKPYCTVFDLNNGNIKKTEILKNSNYIFKIDTINNRKLLLASNDIIELKEDSILEYKIFNPMIDYGEMIFFIDNTVNYIHLYDTTEKYWKQAYSIKDNNDDLIILTSNGLLHLDFNFNILSFYPIDELRFSIYETEKYKYFENYIKHKRRSIFNGIIKYNKETCQESIFIISDTYLQCKNKLYISDKSKLYIFHLE